MPSPLSPQLNTVRQVWDSDVLFFVMFCCVNIYMCISDISYYSDYKHKDAVNN